MDHWMANTPVPATLLLITSDKDSAMALKKVERTGYNTILASDEGNVAQLLEYAASSVSRNANDDDLKKSYRRLAMKWHPVKNPLTKKAAEAKFKQISVAYDVLSDPQRRHAYDQHGGDLRVRLDVLFPSRLTSEQKNGLKRVLGGTLMELKNI
ncbi:hypothetical protein Bca101_069415 [Brassica carinata]